MDLSASPVPIPAKHPESTNNKRPRPDYKRLDDWVTVHGGFTGLHRYTVPVLPRFLFLLAHVSGASVSHVSLFSLPKKREQNGGDVM